MQRRQPANGKDGTVASADEGNVDERPAGAHGFAVPLAVVPGSDRRLGGRRREDEYGAANCVCKLGNN